MQYWYFVDFSDSILVFTNCLALLRHWVPHNVPLKTPRTDSNNFLVGFQCL